MAEKLKTLFAGLQGKLQASLTAAKAVIDHPSAKGDASEANWLQVLQAHLPNRYQADKAFVIDSDGMQSEQIDIVIYDRQYTPVLYNQDGHRIVPAESVYGVIEAKQHIDKGMVEYAGYKAATVRRLVRTSAAIVHAGGQYPARSLTPIIAGIAALNCSWKPAFGEAFSQTIAGLKTDDRLDIGCAANAGAFDIAYGDDGKPEIDIGAPEYGLAFFFIHLLHRLQRIGTVSAIDYNAYGRWLK